MDDYTSTQILKEFHLKLIGLGYEQKKGSYGFEEINSDKFIDFFKNLLEFTDINFMMKKSDRLSMSEKDEIESSFSLELEKMLLEKDILRYEREIEELDKQINNENLVLLMEKEEKNEMQIQLEENCKDIDDKEKYFIETEVPKFVTKLKKLKERWMRLNSSSYNIITELNMNIQHVDNQFKVVGKHKFNNKYFDSILCLIENLLSSFDDKEGELNSRDITNEDENKVLSYQSLLSSLEDISYL